MPPLFDQGFAPKDTSFLNSSHNSNINQRSKRIVGNNHKFNKKQPLPTARPSYLYLQMNHPVLFSRAIELLSQFTDLVYLQMNPQRLLIQAVDSTKVVLYELTMREGKAFSYLDPALAFSNSKKTNSAMLKSPFLPPLFQGVPEVQIGVNLKILAHSLKGLKAEDELFMLFNTDEATNRIDHDFNSNQNNKVIQDPEIRLTVKKKNPNRVFTFTVSQFIINDHELETFEIEQFDEQVQVEVLMSTNCFSQIMHDLSQVKGERLEVQVCHDLMKRSDACHDLRNTLNDSLRLFFRTAKECVEASIEVQNSFMGHEEDMIISFTEPYLKQLISQQCVDTNSNNDEHEGLTSATTISNEYSFRILSILSKASKISDQMLLQICTNGPLGVLYGLDEGVGSFQFFVAPYLSSNGFSSDSDNEL